MWFEADKNGWPIAFTIRKNSKRIDINSILIGRLQSGKPVVAVTDTADQGLIGLDERAPPLSLSLKRLNIVIEEGKVKRIRRG